MLRKTSSFPYHPSYWLSALGAGGLSVSFFMYLMWMLPHQGTPIPTWDHLVQLWSGQLILPTTVFFICLAATVAIIAMATLHFVLLIWNIGQLRAPGNREVLEALEQSGGQVQMMSVQLTLAMTINVCFILGALFVPGLWSVVEHLFPWALVAFAWVGVSALRRYGGYLASFLVHGGFKGQEHNHLSGLMAVFTFSMISVGFAAPAAMSSVATTSALAATLSIFFFVMALVVTAIVLISSISAILAHGLTPAATPSLWMLVPILTLLGIEWMRLQHGLSNHFSSVQDDGQVFYTLTVIFMLQIGIILFGFKVMRMNGYLRDHLTGQMRDPVSFGLICPGVALIVMGMFWWHLAWVQTGLVMEYGSIYWVGIAILAIVQIITAIALLRLTLILLLGRGLSEPI